jgi:hypothetical protein
MRNGFLGVLVQHGAVGGQYGGNFQIQGLQGFEGLFHVFRKGRHNAVVIIPALAFEHLVRQAFQNMKGREVAAEHVAGEQGTACFIIGEERVRPVEKGRRDNAKLPAAQVNLVPVFDHGHRQIRVGDEGKVHRRSPAAKDARVFGNVQQLLQSTGMVRLAVLDDDAVDLCRVDHLAHQREAFFKKTVPHTVDEGDFFRPLHDVGVVARTEIGFHNHVKPLHVRVQGAGPVDAVGDFDRCCRPAQYQNPLNIRTVLAL